MKQFMKLFFLILFSGFLFACDDETETGLPEHPDDEQSENKDIFFGKLKDITIPEGMEDFHSPTFTCNIMAEDGTLFSRKGRHSRFNNVSTLMLEQGLKHGTYRLLELTYYEIDKQKKDTIWLEYGLGCRINVDETETNIHLLEDYNRDIHLFGKGTKEQPFIICSGAHLLTLSLNLRQSIDAKKMKANLYFKQYRDINLKRACDKDDPIMGWKGIGNSDFPFRCSYDGGGFNIRNLRSTPFNEDGKRTRNVAGAGLFAYTQGANIYNVHIKNAFVEGDYGIGAIVGCALTEGNKRTLTSLVNCTVSNSEITGMPGSLGIGGIIGTADLHTPVLLDSCYVHNTKVTGHYDVGGIFGAPGQYSTVVLEGCGTDTKTSVTGKFSCVGGLVGAADSLAMVGCINRATVTGATQYTPNDTVNSGIGTGGLAGAAYNGHINASINEGSIKGYDCVGGLVGSTRIVESSDGEVRLGEMNIVNSQNKANIKGTYYVGGICGEAQFSGFALLNEGHINATGSNTCVGGIIANSSSCALHNAVNTGVITTDNYCDMVGGISGRTLWASLYACQNFGKIEAKSYILGGIAGGAGSYSVINNCANFADLTCPSEKSYIGGIAGSIGSPKNWSKESCRTCIIETIKIGKSLIDPFKTLYQLYKGGTNKMARSNSSTTSEFITTMPVSVETTYENLNEFIQNVNAPYLEKQRVDSCIKANILKANENKESVVSQMASIRNNFKATANLLPDRLDVSLFETYNSTQSNLLKVYENDLGATVNNNINETRQNRLQKVQKFEAAGDLTHNIIKGVCMVASGALSIASMAVTGGTSLAAMITVAQSVNAIIKSVEKITATAQDFEDNADIVSQSVNTGNFYCDKSSHVGGIVSLVDNYGVVENCLNAGASKLNDNEVKSNSKHSGIVSCLKERSNLRYCINLNLEWNSQLPICSDYKTTSVYNHNYQYVGDTRDALTVSINLKKDELRNVNTYVKDMNVTNDNNGTWYLTGAENSFPIPCRSVMLNH